MIRKKQVEIKPAFKRKLAVFQNFFMSVPPSYQPYRIRGSMNG